jgi:hypothetical protein
MSQKVLCIVTCNSKYNTGALTFENLWQRGGALGTLHRTATYKTRFHLLHLALKHLTADCTSRGEGGTPQVVGGGGGPDRAVVEMSDVCVMPLERPVVEAFARCY